MYTKENVIKIAKRNNNIKRSYLLVNPLQAKHVPVSPTKSLDMMNELGRILKEKYPKTRLVIGFAETATAIGASVANCFENCIYVQTTREKMQAEDNCLIFAEEHSHAVEQKLSTANLRQALNNTDTVVFIDDEISTGKTLINIINQMRNEFDMLSSKQIVVASIINRVSEEKLEMLKSASIECEQLVKITHDDYDSMLSELDTIPPKKAESKFDSAPMLFDRLPLQNPRRCVDISQYTNSCISVANSVINQISHRLHSAKRVLVLGTEECMYPALILGRELEKNYLECRVFCHATTRSPIEALNEGDYPIKNGYQIHSFYDNDRVTFLYNISSYDYVIVVTDAPCVNKNGINDIAQLFSLKDDENYCLVKGEENV